MVADIVKGKDKIILCYATCGEDYNLLYNTMLETGEYEPEQIASGFMQLTFKLSEVDFERIDRFLEFLLKRVPHNRYNIDLEKANLAMMRLTQLGKHDEIPPLIQKLEEEYGRTADVIQLYLNYEVAYKDVVDIPTVAALSRELEELNG